MDKEQALRKAQKLMAVAMDGRGNGHEAERALAQAETLMRKFGIEQAEIASTKAASDFDWAEAFHPYGPPKNPAKSCPRWFQFISTGVANFTDTIVRLHYDPALGYGVGFYGDRADTLFAQWLTGYLKVQCLGSPECRAPAASRMEPQRHGGFPQGHGGAPVIPDARPAPGARRRVRRRRQQPGHRHGAGARHRQTGKARCGIRFAEIQALARHRARPDGGAQGQPGG
jgi:hypothetical protein